MTSRRSTSSQTTTVFLYLPGLGWSVECAGRSWFTPVTEEHTSLRSFFIEEGPLDCAQLFRQTVGEANYREFLLSQFDAARQPFIRATPSHAALVRLNMPLLFTTNYDELIEAAYAEAGATTPSHHLRRAVQGATC